MYAAAFTLAKNHLAIAADQILGANQVMLNGAKLPK